MIKTITKNIFQIYFKEFGSCVYLLILKSKNILIDTSSKENKKGLLADLKELNIIPDEIDIILLTHNHWDHIENINLFPNAKIYSFEDANLKMPEIKIIETPGHTKNSVCFLYKNVLFSGDTIFHKGFIGRTDFPESVPEKMQNSLDKIKKLDYKILCPGHLV